VKVRPSCPTMTVWVWGAIVVVVVGPPGMVVVVLRGQLPALQASQQLGTSCTQAAPLLGAVHFVSALMEHFVAPVAEVRQHETKPDRPHVDWTAHLRTPRLHCLGRLPLATADFATPATHLMYLRWLVAVAQGHCVSAIARVAAAADGSVQAP